MTTVFRELIAHGEFRGDIEARVTHYMFPELRADEDLAEWQVPPSLHVAAVFLDSLVRDEKSWDCMDEQERTAYVNAAVEALGELESELLRALPMLAEDICKKTVEDMK